MEGQGYPFTNLSVRSAQLTQKVLRAVNGIGAATSGASLALALLGGRQGFAPAALCLANLVALLVTEIRFRRKLTELAKEAVIARLKE